MKKIWFPAATSLGRLLPVLALMAAVHLSIAAQTSQSSQTTPTPVPPTPADQRNESRMFASMEEELRAKREIQAAEKSYRDNLNRARDLASLCVPFKEKKSLDRVDLKKLDRAEKLAKGIRDAVGGSADEIQLEHPPADLSEALSQLADMSESLKAKVEKTPKRVVSTAVIDEANALLELIRIIRNMQPKT